MMVLHQVCYLTTAYKIINTGCSHMIMECVFFLYVDARFYVVRGPSVNSPVFWVLLDQDDR